MAVANNPVPIWNLGAVSIRKTVLPGMAIPMLKIRRPNGRFIFNMEKPYVDKTVLILRRGPGYLQTLWSEAGLYISCMPYLKSLASGGYEKKLENKTFICNIC